MHWKTLLVPLALTISPGAARAQVPDPAIATVAAFNDTLFAAMHHQVAGLGAAVAADFNVEIMAGFIVGPPWAAMSTTDHNAVSAALSQYLVARFAGAFDSFSGEHFQVDGVPQVRGPDKLVRTQVIALNGPPSRLDYRLRAYDGRWRIIDVYLNGVSQLTTQRADLAAIAGSGAQPLVAHLNAATRALQ